MYSHRARQGDGAVLVGVLQPDIEDDRPVGGVPLETRLEVFLRDPRYRHVGVYDIDRARLVHRAGAGAARVSA